MTEKSSYSPGTPCWIDLGSPDVARSLEFYGGLFGWEGVEQGPGSGGYTMLMLGGRTVAAVAPLMGDDEPATWRIYISTADADETTHRARNAGATVLVEPMDVLTAGRMAAYLDSADAAINVWQPDQHRGAQLVDVPNSWAWSELLVRDIDAAIEFYNAVFDWGIRRDSHYNEWEHGGRSIGGLMTLPEMVPAEVAPFWMPYIAVEDPVATGARAIELGGSVRVPAQDFGGGVFAVIDDPHGAGIGLLRLQPDHA
jgi:predicted enzyme related to lactoylglutathione lyase